MELECKVVEREEYDNGEGELKEAEVELSQLLDGISPELNLIERQDYATCNYFVLGSQSRKHQVALEKAVSESLTPRYTVVALTVREGREGWPGTWPVETLAVKRQAFSLSMKGGSSPTIPWLLLRTIGVLVISYVLSLLYRLHVR
jgi:hypothetical protein